MLTTSTCSHTIPSMAFQRVCRIPIYQRPQSNAGNPIAKVQGGGGWNVRLCHERKSLRRVGGEAWPTQTLNQGFVLGDDANAFFTTAESFAQLQVSVPSSQRADFDRSTSRLAAEEGGFLGVNTIGGPTG